MERENELGRYQKRKESERTCICVTVWPLHSSFLPRLTEWAERVKAGAQANSFWHLQTGILLALVIAAGWDFNTEGATKKHVIIILVDGEFWASVFQIPPCSHLELYAHCLKILWPHSPQCQIIWRGKTHSIRSYIIISLQRTSYLSSLVLPGGAAQTSILEC